MATMMEHVSGELSKPLDISGIAKGSADALHAGMALAQRRQELELKRQELETNKKYAQVQTGYFVMGKLKEIALEKDPAMKKIMIEGLDSQMREMGLGGVPKGTQVWMKTPSYGEMYMKAYRVFSFMQEHKPEEAEKIIMGLPEHVQQPTLQLVDSFRAAAGAQAKIDQFKSQQAQREERLNQGQQRIEKVKDDQATAAGRSFDNDKLLTQYSRQKDALARALHTIKSGGIITPQLKAEIEREIGTAIAGQGIVSEGAINRLEFNPAAVKVAQWLQNIGNKPVDLKKTAPEVIGFLEDTITRLNDAYAVGLKNRAETIAKNFEQTSNPKVQAIVDAKLKKYSGESSQQEKSTSQVDQERRRAQMALAKVQEQYKDDPAGRDKMLEQVRSVFKKKTGLDLEENKAPVQAQPAQKPMEIEAAGDEQAQAATQMGEQQPPEEQPTGGMEIEPVQEGEENADGT